MFCALAMQESHVLRRFVEACVCPKHRACKYYMEVLKSSNTCRLFQVTIKSNGAWAPVTFRVVSAERPRDRRRGVDVKTRAWDQSSLRIGGVVARFFTSILPTMQLHRQDEETSTLHVCAGDAVHASGVCNLASAIHAFFVEASKAIYCGDDDAPPLHKPIQLRRTALANAALLREYGRRKRYSGARATWRKRRRRRVGE